MAKLDHMTSLKNPGREINVKSADCDGKGINIDEYYAKKNGVYTQDGLKASYAEEAKNIKPVSENSGITQTSPFIFQATGTANNTTSTAVPPKANQLEKRANSVKYIQLAQTFSSDYYKSQYSASLSFNNGEVAITPVEKWGGLQKKDVDFKANHKYLLILDAKGTASSNISILKTYDGSSWNSISGSNLTSSYKTFYKLYTPLIDITQTSYFPIIQDDNESDWTTTTAKNLRILDITEWESDVVTYLTSNPSKISNYYNGDYHYSTGEIIDSDGVVLESIEFNQWDEEWEVGSINGMTGQKSNSNNHIRSKNYIRVIPNSKYYFKAPQNIFAYAYDDNKNYIGGLTIPQGKNGIVQLSDNCHNILFRMDAGYGTTYNHDICINLSWDGERDGEYKPFVKHPYNTGSEKLRSARSVCDIKVPSGVITRNIGTVDLSTLTFSGSSGTYYIGGSSLWGQNSVNLRHAIYLPKADGNVAGDNTMRVVNGNLVIYSNDTPTGILYYEKATPTTEQGTPFAEAIEVDDYGTMGWKDENGNYVVIPQGCKIFYFADYALLIDDMNNYTEGDVTKLALKSDVTEEISAAVGDLIDDLEDGSVIPKLAENLKAYSDESGALQDEPFINQPTATANGTEIVTTGDFCELKSKNGNTVGCNQKLNKDNYGATTTINGITFTNNGDGTISVSGTASATTDYSLDTVLQPTGNHYFLCFGSPATSNENNYFIYDAYNANKVTANGLITPFRSSVGSITFKIRVLSGVAISGTVKFEPKVIDLTQWFGSNDNIPQDLLDHSSNFFRYYNGSLAYNTGELVNCNGRYLECGQSRNIWDEEWELGSINQYGELTPTNEAIRSKNPIRCIGGQTYYITDTNAYVVITFYDNSGNKIAYTGYGAYQECYNGGSHTFVAPQNAVYMRFRCSISYGTTYNHDITISIYYTQEQGGEGYNQYYPYKAPILIDTGSEELLAFDTKHPSGVIERNTQDDTISVSSIYNRAGNTNVCFAVFTLTKAFAIGSGLKAICPKGIIVSGTTFDNCSNSYIILVYDTQNKQFAISLPYGTTLESAQSLLNGTHIQYRLATPTTEQGTPYTRYPDINDYSYMLWKDTNNALVTIPQGVSIFYPVNYAGYIDDVYARTDGDASNLVIQSELTAEATTRSNQDTILQNAIGGTLRQCLGVKESIDFDNTNVVDLGTLNWNYSSTYQRFECNTPIADMKKPATNSSAIKAVSTIYNIGDANSATNLTFAVNTSGELRIFDNTVSGNKDTLLAKLKGVLLAYEKA